MSTQTASPYNASGTEERSGFGIQKGLGAFKYQKLFALLLLFAQIGITITGSIVRVTGSGLGCASWPNCHEGSLVPVQGAAPAIHQAIEFGNRMLTFVLLVFVALVIISVFKARRRNEIIVHSLVQLAGVIVQAVIGGVSVLIDLKWWAVAIHFLPSMILVWLAAILYQRIKESDFDTPRAEYPRPIQLLALGAAISLAIVLVTGTMTTGAGNHSGDAGIGPDGRFTVDIAEMAHIHAHFMYLYLGLTVGLVVSLITFKAPRRVINMSYLLIAFIVFQAIIGIVQYWFGVPRWTVPFHVGMSGVVTAYTAFVYAAGWVRRPEPVEEVVPVELNK